MGLFLSVNAHLLSGFGTTLAIFALTLLGALPLGLIISFGSMSRWKLLRWLPRTIVWVVRGTPLMLQLIIIYYGPGLLFDWPLLDRFTAVLVAFIINYACYFQKFTEAVSRAFPGDSLRPDKYWA